MLFFAFAAGLILSSFMEYWLHRLAHAGVIFKETHRAHHAARHHPGGWLRECLSIVVIVLPWFCWVGFPFGFDVGLAVLAAQLVYIALSGYVHQLSHCHPDQLLWLGGPTHYLHHHHRKGNDNFGIVTAFWDRVFGTYSATGWHPVRQQFSLRKLAGIKWF
jgi:sterol desaturase/sphingolipid hydroxylase (fatty acid hydroxylase superfamily)